MAEQKLKRNLSFISMIALASGAVIGGWLAEAPYWFSVTGTGAGGYVSLVIYCLLGVVMYMVTAQYRKKDPKAHALITLTPEDVDKDF